MKLQQVSSFSLSFTMSLIVALPETITNLPNLIFSKHIISQLPLKLTPSNYPSFKENAKIPKWYLSNKRFGS